MDCETNWHKNSSQASPIYFIGKKQCNEIQYSYLRCKWSCRHSGEKVDLQHWRRSIRTAVVAVHLFSAVPGDQTAPLLQPLLPIQCERLQRWKLLVWFVWRLLSYHAIYRRGWMAPEERGQDPERIDGGLTQVISRRKPSRTEDNHESPQESRLSFPILSRYLPDSVTLQQRVQCREVLRNGAQSFRLVCKNWQHSHKMSIAGPMADVTAWHMHVLLMRHCCEVHVVQVSVHSTGSPLR